MSSTLVANTMSPYEPQFMTQNSSLTFQEALNERDVVARSARILKGNGSDIGASTDEEEALELPPSPSTKKTVNEKGAWESRSVNVKMEIPSSAQGSPIPRFGQEQGQISEGYELDAPPSSHPRHVSSDLELDAGGEGEWKYDTELDSDTRRFMEWAGEWGEKYDPSQDCDASRSLGWDGEGGEKYDPSQDFDVDPEQKALFEERLEDAPAEARDLLLNGDEDYGSHNLVLHKMEEGNTFAELKDDTGELDEAKIEEAIRVLEQARAMLKRKRGGAEEEVREVKMSKAAMKRLRKQRKQENLAERAKLNVGPKLVLYSSREWYKQDPNDQSQDIKIEATQTPIIPRPQAPKSKKQKQKEEMLKKLKSDAGKDLAELVPKGAQRSAPTGAQLRGPMTEFNRARKAAKKERNKVRQMIKRSGYFDTNNMSPGLAGSKPENICVLVDSIRTALGPSASSGNEVAVSSTEHKPVEQPSVMVLGFVKPAQPENIKIEAIALPASSKPHGLPFVARTEEEIQASRQAKKDRRTCKLKARKAQKALDARGGVPLPSPVQKKRKDRNGPLASLKEPAKAARALVRAAAETVAKTVEDNKKIAEEEKKNSADRKRAYQENKKRLQVENGLPEVPNDKKRGRTRRRNKNRLDTAAAEKRDLEIKGEELHVDNVIEKTTKVENLDPSVATEREPKKKRCRKSRKNNQNYIEAQVHGENVVESTLTKEVPAPNPYVMEEQMVETLDHTVQQDCLQQEITDTLPWRNKSRKNNQIYIKAQVHGENVESTLTKEIPAPKPYVMEEQMVETLDHKVQQDCLQQEITDTLPWRNLGCRRKSNGKQDAEAPRFEGPVVAIAQQEITDALPWRNLGCRRKSNNKQNAEAPRFEGPVVAIAQPLVELNNTNSKTANGGSQNRDHKDSIKTTLVGIDIEQHSKGHHSDSEQQSPEQECGLGKTIVDIDNSPNAPGTPPQGVKVVVYTPSETRGPLDENGISQPTATQSEDDPPPDTAINDNGSLWSISHYGGLDWDHSGDEFDNIHVTPKPKRRCSMVSRSEGFEAPSREFSSAPPERTSRRKFISLDKSVRARSMSRDAKGRFSSKEHVRRTAKGSSPVTPKKKATRKEHLGSNKKPLNVNRDAHGRFSPKEKAGDATNSIRNELADTRTLSSNVIPSTVARDSSIKFAPKKMDDTPAQDNLSKGAKVKKHDKNSEVASEKPSSTKRDKNGKFSVKAKKQTTKSPYFTPPVSPLKDDSPEVLNDDVNGELSTKTSKKRSSSKAPKSKAIKKEEEESPKKRPPGGAVSCIPFPPLSAPYFGLIQEKLANDPFRLLVAVTFLIRTHGKHAIPVFYELMDKYPTPQSLIEANKEDIIHIIRHLGLQNQRASTYQIYAEIWLNDIPAKGKRYAVRSYPNKESGRNIKKDVILSDEDEREAWEIGHMTQGPYAIDSWRIFCRDVLRGEAEGWNGEGSKKEGFQPEWMRVLPEDKELRAYLRWMWLKEGFEWDPFTGEKEVASQELMKAAIEGRIAWDDTGGMRILDEVLDFKTGLSQVGNLGDEDRIQVEEDANVV